MLRALLLYAAVLMASSGPTSLPHTPSKSSLMRREMEIDKQHAEVAESLNMGLTDGVSGGSALESENKADLTFSKLSFAKDAVVHQATGAVSAATPLLHTATGLEAAVEALRNRTELEEEADNSLSKLNHAQESKHKEHPQSHLETSHGTFIHHRESETKMPMEVQTGNASVSINTGLTEETNRMHEISGTGLMRKEIPRMTFELPKELTEKSFPHMALLRKEEPVTTPVTQVNRALPFSADSGLLRTERRGAPRVKTAIEVSSRADLDADDGADHSDGYTTKVQRMLNKRARKTPENSGTFSFGVVHVILVLCIAAAAAVGLPWLAGGVAKKPDPATLIAYGGVDKGDVLNEVYADAQRRRAQALAASLSRSAVGVVV